MRTGWTRQAIPFLAGSAAALAVSLSSPNVFGQGAGADWPSWRGPTRDGISTESAWNPAALKGGATVAWRKNVGVGWGTVSVKAHRLYTLGNVDDRDIIYCLNATTGDELWTQSYACKATRGYAGPQSTPVLDEGCVYSVSRDGDVYCVDAATGKIQWNRNVGQALGARAPKWKHAASPCVQGNLLLLNAGVAGAALDKKTGRTVWQSAAGIGGYATPVVFDLGGKTCAAIFGEEALYGVEAATGARLWSFPWKTKYDVNAGDPVVFGSKVFISSGYSRGCALLDLKGRNPVAVWENREMDNHFSSSVYLDGFLYGVDGNAGRGELRCLDAATGAVRWGENLGFGSLIVADKKLVVLNERGLLVIAAASPDGYKEFSRAQVLDRPKCWTSPVLSHGKIYCRNNQGDLACVDVSR